MSHELRPYQSQSLFDLRSAIARGVRAAALMMTTGAGKTTVAAEIMAGAVRKGKRAYFVVDSKELLDQAADRFEAEGMEVGIIQGQNERTDYGKPVQVATIQTLRNRWEQIAASLRPNVIVIDECFVAGTRVRVTGGTKPIEEIQPGDLVANAAGWGEVISTTAKPASELIRLELSDGNVITCTSNHPFFTSSGWVNAEAMAVGSRLYREEDLRSLRDGVRPEDLDREGRKADLPEGGGLESPEVLRELLREECGESVTSTRGGGRYLAVIEEDWSPSEGQGRERQGDDSASGPSARGSRPGLGGREDGEGGDGSRKWLADPLQAGSGERIDDDCHRGGRRVSHAAGSPGAGRQEGRFLEVVRVDRDPGEECGRDQTVFNLQVAGHPSYFAEGALVHNCHVLHQAHEEIIAWAKDHKVPVIGLSATPWRKGLGLHFEELVVGATTQMLVEQGYLVPSICYAPRIPNLDAVKTRSDGDWQEDALAEVMGDAALMGDIVQHWYRHARDRQTLVFATNVAHSRGLCDAFLKAGIKAAHIDGYERDPEVREQIINDFRAGRIQVLCNCAILTKGFDAPETSCLVLARPTKSLMLHYQMLGRGLRIAPGKEDCLILDHAGNCLRNGVPEDRVPATLDDGKNGRQLDRKQSEPTEPVAKPCSSCGHVSKLHKCPACGFAPERREDVEVKDGELYPITKRQEPKWQPADVRSLYAELLGHAQLKGFKPGWAYHKCREFTGTAPRDTKQIEPRHPGDKTLGMIKHMQIKKAKAKAKAQQQGVPA